MNRTGSAILHGLLLATSGLVGSTLIASTAAMAGGGPTGGTVAVGSATIINASPTQTVVNQSSKKALINWNSFSIPGGSSVKFNQPNSKSLTVNRVTGPNASTIDGALLANGNVWLINANGVLFGKGSQINVGALLATTSDLSDDDFKAGKYNFKPATNPDAAVINKGTITAGANGSVVLSAPRVSNEGMIQADFGTVVLGGAKAFTVDMTGDNLLRYEITAPVTNAPKDANGSIAAALVSNSGAIEAAGGHVVMTARAARNVESNVINNTGMVEATSVSSHNGVIDLDVGPDGTVNDSGTLNVSGTAQGQTGGTVNVTGGTVNVADGAKINASGDVGGGTVQIGGGLHGQGTLAHAQRTIIGNATITADATSKGNGGTVAVWSDSDTSFTGAISAKGGAKGGNGGQVETSGHNLGVSASAKVDTSAPLGLSGDWLLDPYQIYIQSGGSDGVGSTNGTAYVDPTAIISALGSGDVTLQTGIPGCGTSLINVNSSISYTSSHTLSLLSQGEIDINANIQNSGTGALNLIAGWDGTTTNFSGAVLSTAYGQNDGNVVFNGTVAVGGRSGATLVAGNRVLFGIGNSGTIQLGYHVGEFSPNGGGGDIRVLASNNVVFNANSTVLIGNGNLSGNVTAPVTGNVSIVASDTIVFGSDSVTIGNANGSNSINATGSVSVIVGAINEDGNTPLEKSLFKAVSYGDVFLGVTDDDYSLFADDIFYTSSHAFTLATTNDLSIGSSVQNEGTGALNLIAGWDGHTTSLASLTAAGVYGNNGGDLSIVGIFNDVSVGSMGGKTTALGYDVNVTGGEGHAQIGFNDANATGAIDVRAIHDISVTAGTADDEDEESIASSYAQIGHGGAFVVGADSGNISVRAGGNITVAGGGGTFDYGQIGNGGDADVPGTGSKGDSGNITVIAGGAIDVTGSVDYAQIGNGGWGSNGSSGAISVSANGDITLTGAEGSEWGYAQIGNGGQYSRGVTSGNISVTTNGTLTLIGGDNGLYAQIGNGGDEHSTQNSTSGNIAIVAGNLTLVGASDVGEGEGYVAIGNSAIYNSGTAGSGVASGNISIKVSGTTAVQTTEDEGDAWIGNASFGGTESGSVSLITGTLDDSADDNDDIHQFLLADILGGAVTVGITDATATNTIGGLDYTSSNALTILSAGNLTVTGDILNSGTGNLTLVAGWKPSVAPENVLTTAGSYGVGGKLLTIGGSSVSGNVIVGTKGGTTNVLTGSLLVSANNGNAQLGYYGAGTGAINVYALGNVTVQTEANGTMALIGNGGFGTAGAITGNIAITAGGNVTVRTDASSTIADIGNTGGDGSSQSGNISVQAGGRLLVTTTKANSTAQIGNQQVGSSAPVHRGDASGNIAITAGSVVVTAGATNTGALIGNGNGLLYNQNVSGNIVLNTGNLALSSSATDSTGTIARIGARANGNATGNITVVAAGNISLAGGAYGNAIIGQGALGTASGNLSVAAAGFVDLEATGNASQARIGNAGLNSSGNIAVTAAGALTVAEASGSLGLIGSFNSGGTTSGNVVLTAKSADGIGDSIVNDLSNGDFTLNSLGTQTLEIDSAVNYSSSHKLTVTSNGDIVFDASVQNAGTGNITFASAGDITIGGSDALGDVAVGSKGGVTTIAADNLLLSATKGYAQLGYHGGGSGAIVAAILGDVTLTGGGSTGYYAQIGDGGYKVKGSSSENVSVVAGGDVALNGGAGQEAYAQIGNGGAESNSNSTGYSETGLVTVAGETVTLSAGSGSGSYAQIGHGGYKSGQSLNGTATLSGDIVVAAVDAIRLVGGGADAYAQIGQGGDFVNTGAANGSSGTISGNITVTVATPNTKTGPDPLTLTAGAGANSYAQIGNGGQGENTPVAGGVVNFTISGDVNVADLTLTGSNTGANGYSQIGNGDASKTGTGNVSGQVTLGQGTNIKTIPGSAPGASAGFGNLTGVGTVSGTILDNTVIDPGAQGSVASITQNPTGPTNFNITTVNVTPENTQPHQFDSGAGPQGPTPLDKLADESNAEGKTTSDSVAESVGQSLGDGKTIYVTSKTLIPGMLKQIVTLTRNNPNGVPPADEDYSSWGNEALWRW